MRIIPLLTAFSVLSLDLWSGTSISQRWSTSAPAAQPEKTNEHSAPKPPFREQTVDQQVQQVLNRLAFGPRPGDAAMVRAMGVDKYIERQLQPSKIPDDAVASFVKGFKTLGMSGEQLIAAYPPPGAALAKLARERKMENMSASNGAAMPGDNLAGMISAADSAKLRAQGRQSYLFLGEIATSKVARAVISDRQLEEVMVDFWENHFNVFAGKDRTRYFLNEYDAKTIRPNALGKFRDLLGAVAKSPAMLYYLDNWQSVADSGQPTLGNQFNGPRAQAIRRGAAARRQAAAGTPAIPAAARRRGLNENYARELMELHTLGVDGGYRQQDVVDVARALTGWTLSRGANGGEFAFRAQAHDAGAKKILGKNFPAGKGEEEGEQVLDMLASNPATAQFIATKLARRFVSDTPPADLVARAAATFTRTDGDIRETLRTIITSPEFFSNAAYRSKVKSPFELVTSTLRAMGAEPDATPRTVQLVTRLGQPIFGHQAPNGYPETSDAWMNTGSILNRINFGLAVAAGRVPGVRVTDWAPAQALVSLPREGQVDGVIRELLGGSASPETRAVLISGTNPFLDTHAADTDTLFAGAGSTSDTGMATTGVRAAAAASRQGSARGARGARQSDQRTQMAAGRDAVKPSGNVSLMQSIGTIPQLTGLAQIVGLAIGAPEFQRR